MVKRVLKTLLAAKMLTKLDLKTIGAYIYRRDFDETKYMFFFIKDNELLGKYNELRKML